VFNQRLEEDPSVNRLEDSILLWKSICSAKVLRKTQLILFLNKCDILRRKLKRGIQVNRYIPSYGNRPNETTSVIKCMFSWCGLDYTLFIMNLVFREKFKEIQRQYSPGPRSIYMFGTTVIVRLTSAV
jgi:guanine nucleotide-binding protein subunit alpha